MKFPEIDHLLTGVAVPVAALKSKDSCGCGEFSDLTMLGKWCKQTGLELIQILPVNDTGFMGSPYSALSAYALHPLYMRLQALPGTDKMLPKIEEIREKHESNTRINLYELVLDKLSFLKQLYEQEKETILADKKLTSYIRKNQWVKEYAVYRYLWELFGYERWQDWPEYRDPKKSDIDKLWKKEKEATRFWAWIQMHLEKQLVKASKDLTKQGVALKGDIPIMMNEDSVDIWAHREFFHLDQKAGAPADAFSPAGQNWGFPIYNWDELEQDGYSWWKQRLQEAAKYYHAYRIDHVLGFFRIWSIPDKHFTGSLGFFCPSRVIHKDQLWESGFNDGRIAWLAKPHIYGHELRAQLGHEANDAIRLVLNRIGNEDLFLFKPEVAGENNIQRLPLSKNARNHLLMWLRDRTLIPMGDDTYAPNWSWEYTRGFQTLSGQEKKALQGIINEVMGESEKLWEDQGRKLLSFMTKETDMLVCAEDLGAIPDCVPKVLNELNILGLKIVRWARKYQEEGEPIINVNEYPTASVCTLAVHDTTTIRGWWTNEEQSKDALWSALGIEGPCSYEFSPETAQRLIGGAMNAASLLAIFQIQDFFSMDIDLWMESPEDERINVPGTVSDTNWGYRIVLSLEDMIKYKKLNNRVSKLIEKRRERKISFP